MHALKPLHVFFLLGIALLVILPGCRKDRLFTDDPNARLVFSRDSILFDTVFTQPQVGPELPSVMKRFVARNPQDRSVRVNISLAGGTPSPFRINVDGLSGVTFQEVEILPGDSVYVFVEATLDQSNTNNPLVIEDQVIFTTNGNQQEVLLQAWGQDAYYHRPGPADIQIPGFPTFGIVAGGLDENQNPICETVTWASDKPHVILGYAVVDSCSTLIIQPGAKIHVHGGGGMWIYRFGRILANGTLEQPIIFQGDRLEPFYQELPGQWDRIWINEGEADSDNEFTYVTIKNALIGLQPETLLPDLGISASRLILNNVSIRNCSAAGILSRNYRISSDNLFVGDCGQHSVALTGGGEYSFRHTTIANYWNIGIRQTPAFIMTNIYQAFNGEIFVGDIVNSEFLNGIIYGSNANEFQLGMDDAGAQDISFDRFLFRTDGSTPTNTPEFFPFQDRIYLNQDPGFVNIQERNFDLNTGGFARNKAIPVPGSLSAFIDILGRSRDCDFNGFTDLGAYEPCP